MPIPTLGRTPPTGLGLRRAPALLDRVLRRGPGGIARVGGRVTPGLECRVLGSEVLLGAGSPDGIRGIRFQRETLSGAGSGDAADTAQHAALVGRRLIWWGCRLRCRLRVGPTLLKLLLQAVKQREISLGGADRLVKLGKNARELDETRHEPLNGC